MDNGNNHKKCILVVDDEPGIVKMLGIQLKFHGYEVITATGGAEAIEIIRTQHPDAVLLDILMPDVTGMDVLESVRSFSQVPIVVFTAKPDIIQFAMKLGANDSLSKPFDPDLVVEKIETVLGANGKKQ